MNKSIILTDGPPGIGVTRMHYLTEKSFRETGGL